MSAPGSAPAVRARRLRFAPTLAALVVVALTCSLGAWQLRRADEKRALHERAVAAAHAVAVSIARVPVAPADLDGRRVSVRGHFVEQATVFIDNRTYNGIAGFHVVTPVRIEGSDLHVLVLRGWVARDPRDRVRLPEIVTPAAPVVVEGLAEATIAQALELKAAATPGPTDRLWQNVAFERFERWSGLKLQRVLVRQTDGPSFGDGLVRDWRDAGGDVGKHLGYAFQWYALALLTALLWVYFTFIRRRDDTTDAP